MLIDYEMDESHILLLIYSHTSIKYSTRLLHDRLIILTFSDAHDKLILKYSTVIILQFKYNNTVQ